MFNDTRDIDRNSNGWMKIVEEYVTYHFKKSPDALPAMFNIAECWDGKSENQRHGLSLEAIPHVTEG